MSVTYADLDEAIDKFVKVTFSKNNMALAFDGIRKHKIIEDGKDFDDYSDAKIREMVERYWAEFYEQDFPEFVEVA